MHGIKAFPPLLLVLIIIITFLKISKFLWKNHREEGGDCGDGAIMFNIFGGIIGLAGIITLVSGFMSNFLPFVQCLVAPKIYIIEQVINLVQK
jgi:hypothetical protein